MQKQNFELLPPHNIDMFGSSPGVILYVVAILFINKAGAKYRHRLRTNSLLIAKAAISPFGGSRGGEAAG
jgi:hypothetical protein